MERIGVMFLTGAICGYATMNLVFTVLEFNAFSVMFSMVSSTLMAVSFIQWFD